MAISQRLKDFAFRALLMIGVGLAGGVAVNFWVLTKIFENQKEIGQARVLVIEQIARSEQNLRASIESVNSEVIRLNSALGESPQQIAIAARSVLSASDQIDIFVERIRSVTVRLTDLEDNISALRGDASDIRSEIVQIREIVDELNNNKQ